MKYVIAIILCFICMIPSYQAQALETFQIIASEPQPKKAKRLQEPEEIIEEKEEDDASFIWNYLQSLGYSSVVCAGILGNIMVECGGNTLDLQTMIETDDYYGMCQWSKKYYPEAIGKSLEEQCDFLRDTIEYELDTFGCGYDTFLKQEDSRTAALKFAKGYERCSGGSYTLRQDCAELAYKYFVLEEQG